MHTNSYTTYAFPKSFPTTEEREFLKLLTCDDVQFSALFQAWKRHVAIETMDHASARLLSLLYKRVQAHAPGDEFLPVLRGVYKATWARNQRLLHAAERVADLLRAQNIDMLVLKGIPLLLDAYKDTGARFLSDVDILIHPRHRRVVLRVLREHGWSMHSPYFPCEDLLSDEQIWRAVKEMTLINDQGIELDVHWDLFDYSERDQGFYSFERVWERSQIVRNGDHVYRALAPEDALVHVMVHGAEGNPHRTIRWVTDALALIQTHPIRWDIVFDRATQSGHGIEVYTACRFLQEEGFVVFPELWERRIQETLFSKQEQRAYANKANVTIAAFGRLPHLWKMYWTYECNDHRFRRVFELFSYLAHAWGFVRVRDLVPFIVRKLYQRMQRRWRAKKT